MNVGVDPAGGDDFSFTGDYFRSSADDHSGGDSTHHIRIAGFADSRDSSVAYSDIRFVDSAVVHDHRIRDHQIENAVGPGCGRRLSHSIANYFAPAEFGLLTGSCEVLLNFDEQIGVGEPDAVAGGRSVQIGVLAAWNFQTHALVVLYKSFQIWALWVAASA